MTDQACNEESFSIPLLGKGSAGEIPLAATVGAGLYGMMIRAVGPQIRGGETAALIRSGHAPFNCLDDRFNVLLGIDCSSRIPAYLRWYGFHRLRGRAQPRGGVSGVTRASEDFSQRFTLAEFLAHALVIELQAVQSYKDLAVQMAQCGNAEVAGLFEKLSELEAGHVAQVREKVGDIELPKLAPWEYRWPGVEPPENTDLAGVHYLSTWVTMTPRHALELALENELNAMAFFEAMTNGCADENVRSLASEFADSEHEHVAWIKGWLAKYPEPGADWGEDPDPPVADD